MLSKGMSCFCPLGTSFHFISTPSLMPEAVQLQLLILLVYQIPPLFSLSCRAAWFLQPPNPTIVFKILVKTKTKQKNSPKANNCYKASTFPDADAERPLKEYTGLQFLWYTQYSWVKLRKQSHLDCKAIWEQSDILRYSRAFILTKYISLQQKCRKCLCRDHLSRSDKTWFLEWLLQRL